MSMGRSRQILMTAFVAVNGFQLDAGCRIRTFNNRASMKSIDDNAFDKESAISAATTIQDRRNILIAAGSTMVPMSSMASENPVVKIATTEGEFIVELRPDWAPKGVARFQELCSASFFDKAKFFRVVPGFIVQFGLPADPALSKKYGNLVDDPVQTSNSRGTLTFATAGPNTRTTQLFINYRDNPFLDRQGFAPIGKVISGMDVVDKINAEYAEKPDQRRIQLQGNTYLDASFPRLSEISSTSLS